MLSLLQALAVAVSACICAYLGFDPSTAIIVYSGNQVAKTFNIFLIDPPASLLESVLNSIDVDRPPAPTPTITPILDRLSNTFAGYPTATVSPIPAPSPEPKAPTATRINLPQLTCGPTPPAPVETVVQFVAAPTGADDPGFDCLSRGMIRLITLSIEDLIGVFEKASSHPQISEWMTMVSSTFNIWVEATTTALSATWDWLVTMWDRLAQVFQRSYDAYEEARKEWEDAFQAYWKWGDPAPLAVLAFGSKYLQITLFCFTGMFMMGCWNLANEEDGHIAGGWNMANEADGHRKPVARSTWSFFVAATKASFSAESRWYEEDLLESARSRGVVLFDLLGEASMLLVWVSFAVVLPNLLVFVRFAGLCLGAGFLALVELLVNKFGEFVVDSANKVVKKIEELGTDMLGENFKFEKYKFRLGTLRTESLDPSIAALMTPWQKRLNPIFKRAQNGPPSNTRQTPGAKRLSTPRSFFQQPNHFSPGSDIKIVEMSIDEYLQFQEYEREHMKRKKAEEAKTHEIESIEYTPASGDRKRKLIRGMDEEEATYDTPCKKANTGAKRDGWRVPPGWNKHMRSR